MLYQCAIMLRPTCKEAEAGQKESVLYGPVPVEAQECNFMGAALACVAKAALEGKLPDGYDDSKHRVVGTTFSHFA
jgi:hypothetical protein